MKVERLKDVYFFGGALANIAESGEAKIREAFNIGSASIGIGQMQVATAKMLEENGYVNYGGNTISNLLDPRKSCRVCGWLFIIYSNKFSKGIWRWFYYAISR